MCILERRSDFRRHIVLVVLGQYFVGNEDVVFVQPSVRDDTLTFTEQIEQNTGILYGDCLFIISHVELCRQSV